MDREELKVVKREERRRLKMLLGTLEAGLRWVAKLSVRMYTYVLHANIY